MSLASSVATAATHQRFRKDPQWAPFLSELAEAIECEIDDSRLLSAIHQSNRDSGITVYDTFGICLVLDAIASRKVIVVQIPIVGNAAANANASDNQLVLDSLPDPFRADFVGRQADADGVFVWKEQLQYGDGASLAAGFVPLEVGTTTSWTTWEHITYHGGVARLPYQANCVHLFVSLNPPANIFA